MEHLDENTIYNVSLIIEPREDSPSIKKHPKKKKDSLFKLYSTNINAEQQLSKIESTTKLNKLNKFFGEQSIDFDFYQKYSKNMETPKSILDDINVGVYFTFLLIIFYYFRLQKYPNMNLLKHQKKWESQVLILMIFY